MKTVQTVKKILYCANGFTKSYLALICACANAGNRWLNICHRFLILCCIYKNSARVHHTRMRSSHSLFFIFSPIAGFCLPCATLQLIKNEKN